MPVYRNSYVTIEVNDNYEGDVSFVIQPGVKVLNGSIWREECRNVLTHNSIWKEYHMWEEFYYDEDRKVRVVIPNGVIMIGRDVLNHSSYIANKIEELLIPDSVTIIESSAMSGLIHMRNVTLPRNLNWIGSEAFASCVCLKRVEIPESVKELGGNVFERCLSLEEIKVPSHLLSKYGEGYIKSNTMAKVISYGSDDTELVSQEVPDVVEEQRQTYETETSRDSKSQPPKYKGKTKEFSSTRH